MCCQKPHITLSQALVDQAELLAVMLDLSIRDATNGRGSLDDLVRTLNDELTGRRGFTTADIEPLAGKVSGRSMAPSLTAASVGPARST